MVLQFYSTSRAIYYSIILLIFYNIMHTALNIVIEPFQNGSVLQWDLMRSDHPENCDVMYEITFNGEVLRHLISETQVSKETLIQEGFPYCRSTIVSVAPHVSAHSVIRNLTKYTNYLAIPGKKISRPSACTYQYNIIAR